MVRREEARKTQAVDFRKGPPYAETQNRASLHHFPRYSWMNSWLNASTQKFQKSIEPIKVHIARIVPAVHRRSEFSFPRRRIQTNANGGNAATSKSVASQRYSGNRSGLNANMEQAASGMIQTLPL
jgi:hypothetical protein